MSLREPLRLLRDSPCPAKRGDAVIRGSEIRAEICADLDAVADGEIVMPMTCLVDGFEHGVTDSEFTAGVRRGSGRYRAVCRHVVVPGSHCSPPGRACAQCVALLTREPVSVSWFGVRALSRAVQVARGVFAPITRPVAA